MNYNKRVSKSVGRMMIRYYYIFAYVSLIEMKFVVKAVITVANVEERFYISFTNFIHLPIHSSTSSVLISTFSLS